MHWDTLNLPTVLLNHLLKTKKEYKKRKKQEIQGIFMKNEFDKACFQHDLVYGDFKGFPRRTASNKVVDDKA